MYIIKITVRYSISVIASIFTGPDLNAMRKEQYKIYQTSLVTRIKSDLHDCLLIMNPIDTDPRLINMVSLHVLHKEMWCITNRIYTYYYTPLF